MNKLHKNWKRILSSLNEEEKVAEQKIYKIYIKKNNYVQTMNESDEILDTLRKLVIELKQLLKEGKSDESVDQTELSEYSESENEVENEYNSSEDEENESAPLNSTHKSDDFITSETQYLVPKYKMKIKLPSQTLTKFDGKFSNWNSFWDDFSSSVDDDPELPPIQKFKYLRSVLLNEPYRIAQPYSLTNKNYFIVINLLKDRYGNPTLIKENLLNELKDLYRPTDGTSELRKFILYVNRIILQLQNLGENIDHQLVKLAIETKLPQTLRIKIKEKLNNFTTIELMEFLNNYTQIREELDKSGSRSFQSFRNINNKNNSNIQYQHSFKRNNFKNQNFYQNNKPNWINKNHFQRNKSNFMRKFQDYDRYAQTSAFSTQAKSSQNKQNKTKFENNKNFKEECKFCGRNNHVSKECKIYPNPEKRNARVRELKICINCLRNDHMISDCTSKFLCFNCKGKHHTLLCLKKKTEIPKSNLIQKSNSNIVKEISNTNTLASIETKESDEMEEILMTIDGNIFNFNDQNFEENSIILLDNGSQKSYITNEIADKLNLTPIAYKTLSIATFNNHKPKLIQTRIVQIGIKTIDGNIEPFTVQTVEKITDVMTVALRKTINIDKNKIPVRMRIPHVLIGIDYYWQLMLPNKTIFPLPSGFYSIKTKLGNVLSGKGMTEPTKTNLAIMNRKEKEKLNQTIQEFWNLESIGITDSPNLTDDDYAVIHFNKTVKFENGRYEIRWPFKNEKPDIPTNFGLAFGRLKSTVKKLRKDNQLHLYQDVLQNQMNMDVNEITEFKTNNLTHYLPHQAVIRETSNTTKLRVVFDASAKLRGYNSLNDEIYQGPKCIPDLCGLLLRFRMKKYVLIADLEKAFLQVGLNELDRDTTRFLWLKPDSYKYFLKHDGEIEMKDLEIRRFKRMPFGVNASPFLLGYVIKLHLSKYEEIYNKLKLEKENIDPDLILNSENKKNKIKELCDELNENAYVDNFIMMCDDEKEIKFKHYWSKRIFKIATMNLREFVSNHEKCNKEIQNIDNSEMPQMTKLLGIKWDVNEDELKLKLDMPTVEIGITKRQILQIVAKNFDPMGWISPVILKYKRFFQKLWKLTKDWDEKLTKEEFNEWNEIATNDEIKILRNPYNISRINSAEFHIFTDASEIAYAATGYIKIDNEVKLMFSKTRLTPIKGLTIPKLELLGVLIGTRMAKFLLKESKLTPKNIYLWSDSKCVLNWIKNNKELPTFIRNRIKEIKSISKEFNINFNYIKSKENPADLASRGCSLIELKNSEIWWTGPSWLIQERNNWPVINLEEFNPIKEDIEEFEEETKTNLVTNNEKSQNPIKWNNFSSWYKVIVTMRILLQFTLFKIFNKSELFKEKFNGKIPELNNIIECQKLAEKILIRYIQKEMEPNKDEIKQLGLYKNKEEIYLCGGRLKNAKIHGINPIYLPRKHPGTHLIIMSFHQRNLHAGTLTTLAELRKLFWISKGRRTIDSIRKKCNYCKKYNAKPYLQPIMPPYPKVRVQLTPPFYNIGLDYMGPIQLKNFSQKCWILLFTCLTTRCIHLEFVVSLSVNHFLNAFRRFISRRGIPRNIWSDNAPQLKHSAQVLPEVLKLSDYFKDNSIKNYFVTENIHWHFTIELAPWQNGAVERLNQHVKNAFRKTIGRKLIDIDTFQTLLCEIEAVTNSRPLTYIYDDIDSNQILRPIDFLLPNQNICIPPILEENQYKDPEYNPFQLSYEKTIELWKKTTKNLDNYWKIWNEEYIPSLRERFTINNQNPRYCIKNTPKIDELVLIKENLPRAMWKTGKIIELITGKDGISRGAKIELPNKHIINRAMSNIYPLELYNGDEIEKDIVNLVESKELVKIFQICAFCFSTSHESKFCDKFKTYKTRKIRSRNLHLCYKCLQPDHLSFNCQNTENYCNICNTNIAFCKNHKNNNHSKLTISSLITISLILNFFINFVNSDQYICPNNILPNLSKTIWQTKAVTYCTEEGIIIKQNKNTKEFCYENLSCSNRHLRLDHFPYCGPKCECPSWTNACSFIPYDLIKLYLYNKTYIQNILQYSKPKVCSFKKTNNCSIMYKKYFHAIMLYDNSIHLVDSLKIVYNQVISKRDFICLGEGNRTIGTPAYCRVHNCDDYESFLDVNNSNLTFLDNQESLIDHSLKIKYARKFCYFDPREKIFYINNQNKTLPIKAWGQLKRTYFDKNTKNLNKQILKRRKRETLIDHVIIECIKGGISLNSIPLIITDIEICTSGYYCVILKNPKRKEIAMFPQDITTNKYNVDIMLTTKDHNQSSKKIKCDASPICEMINCKFCMEYIRNPQCVEQLHWALIISLIIASIYILSISIKILKILYYLLRWIFQKIILKCCSKNSKKKKLKIIKVNPKRKISLITILFILNLTFVLSCDEVSNLIADTNECAANQNGELECTFERTTLLSLTPEHTVCLNLENKEYNTTVKTIEIKVEDLYVKCAKKSDYFMRDFKLTYSSIKRCPTMGACTGQTCQSITMNQKCPEIGDHANSQPGYSYCVPSCGGWHCQCFIADDGCLFYKTFMESEGNNLYEVIDCPTWTTELMIEISEKDRKELIKDNHPQISLELPLSPGILTKNTEGNIWMTLASTSIPPTPLFGSKFIIDRTNSKVIIVDNENLLIKSIRCTDQEKAKNFQCTFPPEACQCHGGDTEAHCECIENPLPKMFSNEQYILPVKTKGNEINYNKDSDQITAKLQSTSSLQLQITFKNYKVKTIYDMTNCTVLTKSLKGCYSCQNGVEWIYHCKTSFGSALAEVICPSQKIHINCNDKDEENKIKLNYNTKSIEEKCKIKCPGGESEILLKAQLEYISQQKEEIKNINGTQEEIKTGLNLGSFDNILKFFKDTFENATEIFSFIFNVLIKHWKIVLIIIIIVIIIVCLFPIIFPLFINCISSISRTFNRSSRVSRISRKSRVKVKKLK